MKESILINAISKPAIRLELQTLRAIAIAFVLVFHLWGSVIKNGYLGVDM
jgi:peptidoglycan/LPS O-acetylase OafA/YrhL